MSFGKDETRVCGISKNGYHIFVLFALVIYCFKEFENSTLTCNKRNNSERLLWKAHRVNKHFDGSLKPLETLELLKNQNED